MEQTTKPAGTTAARARMREALRFIRDPLGTLEHLRATEGDVVALPLPGPPVVQFTHPVQVAQLLKLPIKDATTRSMKDIMGEGLLTGSGPDWQRNRRAISKAFAARAVKSFFDTMLSLTEDWLEQQQASLAEVNMTEEMLSLTLDVILKTIFGGVVEVDRGLVARAMEDYFVQFNLDNAGWRRLLPSFVSTPGRRRRRRAMQELERVVYQSIERRRELPPGDDLLWFLLEIRDDQGKGLDARSIRDEVLTLVLAGHETTAGTLTYAMLLLAQHPGLQQRVRAEIRSATADGGITREAVSRCPLVGAVIDETLRLYPPAYIVAREAHEDLDLEGIRARKGAQLLAPAWVIHRDPRWWREPGEFRPERWLNGETTELPPGAYFPFGGGPRLCVGKHFARFEASIILMTVLARLELQPVAGYELELLPSVTLRPREAIRLRTTPAGADSVGSCSVRPTPAG